MIPAVPNPEKRLAVLILAAGESARFGGRKQLALINGKPMIRHALDTMNTATAMETFVVLGAFADEIAPALGTAAHIIRNENWAAGMGSSIACAMSAIADQDRFDGVLITLCDQVKLTVGDYTKLIAAFDQQHILATRHKDGFGVPAIFPSHMFKTLQTLSGASGARKMLNGSNHDVIGIDLPNAAIDIDTVNDLKALQSQTG
ncbi:MAG: nucleotidyltransferase family protein [Thalassospira sp.]|uniref:nucleotidyltransferase family protein n=1 Tax=Thalassospira sp. TaxID=1912094 RepID=UPI0032EBFD4B